MDNKNINEKLDFRQIVLSHIKRILEIGSHELRDTTRHITTSNSTNIIEREDTRFSYIQAIENFAYILIPYFDNEMEKIYKTNIKIINSFKFEILKEFEKEIKEIKEEASKEDVQAVFIIKKRLRSARELFIALNKLLHRNDYLKSSIYGEAKDEVVEEGEN